MDTQFIHTNAVRNTISVITALERCQDKDWLKWSRPAALSTNDPKRNLQGGWKTPACKEVEALLVAARDRDPSKGTYEEIKKRLVEFGFLAF